MTWLRRNLIALIVLVVLAPATVGIAFQREWSSYFDFRASEVVPVQPGARVDYSGAKWHLDDVTTYPSTADEVADAYPPDGTNVVVAIVTVTPGETAPYCSFRLAELVGGSEKRSWGSEFGGIGDDPGISSGCDSEATGEYRAGAAFVVPEDVTGELAVIVESVDGFPKYLLLKQ